MIKHKLKITTRHFIDVLAGRKTFEIRKNDRGYKVGDIVKLCEWKNGEYTGKEIIVQIFYIMDAKINKELGENILHNDYVIWSFGILSTEV